jgi:RNA polymerase sigma factor (sigma-70 family)
MDQVPGDDAARWEAARAGDPAAFGDLYRRHRDRIYGHALRLTRSSPDAEDVTALVFLEAWRRRERVRVVDGTILPWLFVTTANVIRNHERAARRHRAAMSSLPPASAAPDHAPEIDDNIDRLGPRSELRRAFVALSARDQEVVTLCVLEEVPLAEAAATLGIPLGTLKSRLSRAKARLSRSLEVTFDPDPTTGGAR